MSDEAGHTQLDIEVTAKKDELSLKAKGAGLLVLIAICLVGIILVALKITAIEKDYVLMMPIAILSFIANSLIGTLDAVLGLTVRHRD